jgi:hypothetical protein
MFCDSETVPRRRKTSLAATASGGATIAPRAIAAAIGKPAKRYPKNATAAAVSTTATTASEAIGTTLRRKSRGDVSNAASSSAGATNNANARSGSMAIRGANGRKARPAPAMASRDGYGTASSSARLVRTTAASSSSRIHSNIVICTSSRDFGAR